MSRRKPSILSRLLWAGFGAAIALFGVALYLTPTAQDKLAAFFNSNFSTAFFGAVGGSLTIIAIEWFRRQRQVLADINTSIGVLTSLSTALLNMKQQHILPLVTNYSASRQKFEMTNAIRSLFPAETPFSVVTIPMYMSRFQCPELHYDVPMDRIFTHTDKVPQIVMIITQTKRTMGEIPNMFKLWNELVDAVKSLEGDEKIQFYLGLRSRSDMTDTLFPDTVSNLEKAVDDGLFFIERSVEALTDLGNKTLPFWLKKKIAKTKIISKQHRDLMPPKDYKEGWDHE